MMIETGFSSPRRSDALPLGLRVLVVDDDMAWLKILERMLKKCSYEVTTCALAQEALQLLRDRKGGFDIVISDVNMPDMDGFKLLEHVGLEMDLPVIMMSVDGETSRVMKGVQHGACDYLLKPIGMKQLKNIWQHVVRKRMHEGREIECFEDRNGCDPSHNGYYSGDQALLRKRKDVENKHDEKESTDSSSTKKARVVWTVELHQKFVKAVNHIGIDSDKIGPKKILDLMNVPRLTRENVASHLQKYRLYLSRIRKEDEMDDKMESSCRAMKNSDHPPNDNSGTSNITNSTSRQQNDASNNVYPENQLLAGDIGTMSFETDLKSSNLLPLTEERKSFNNESTSKVGLINYASFESPISGCYPWTAEISSMSYEPEYKPHFSFEDCFSQPTLPVLEQHIEVEPLESASLINPGPNISDDIGLIDDSKHMNVKPEGNNIRQLLPIERELESFLVSKPEVFSCVFDKSLDIKSQNSSQSSLSTVNEQTPLEGLIQSFPFHSKSPLLHQQGLDNEIDMALHTNNQSSSQGSNISQDSLIGLDSEQGSQCLWNESDFGLLGEDFMLWWLQGGDSLCKDIGFDYIGLSDFNFPGHVSEVPWLKFGIDYDAFDYKECPVDQGILFS